VLQRLKVLLQSIRDRFGGPAAKFGGTAADATGAGVAFQRWQDPAWKRNTLSLR
jgi:hypothetical protein